VAGSGVVSQAGLPERRRVGLVWAAAAGYGALVAVSVAQTAAGRAPFDLGAAAAALTLAGAAPICRRRGFEPPVTRYRRSHRVKEVARQ